MYAFTAVAKYNPDTWKVQNTPGLPAQQVQITPGLPAQEVKKRILQQEQLMQLDPVLRDLRVQQLEQLNTVYVAAISGSLALGGTLIAQLWGRSSNNP
jgi:hypothetical protein